MTESDEKSEQLCSLEPTSSVQHSLWLEMENKLPRYWPQLIGSVFTVIVIVLARPGSSLFSYHPTLMALAFPFCSVQAIMFYSKHHSFVPSSARAVKTRYHWILQLASLICAACGLAVILYNKELNNKSHFTTRHAQFGLLACIMVAVQCCGGFFALNHQLVQHFIKPAQIKYLHALSGGTATFQLTMLALFLACFSNWLVGAIPTAVIRYLLAAVPIALSLVVYQHTSAEFNR